MANRIKGLDGGSIGSGSGSPIEKIRVSSAANPPGAESPAAAPADSVFITQSARSLAALALAVTDAPEVDTARVAAMQQAIGSGQYAVSPERIASRLLQLEQDLGSAAQ